MKSSEAISYVNVEQISVSETVSVSIVGGCSDRWRSYSLYIFILLACGAWSPCLGGDQEDNSGHSQAITNCTSATLTVTKVRQATAWLHPWFSYLSTPGHRD